MAYDPTTHTYTVEDGDTLTSISMKVYGDPSKSLWIALKNNITIADVAVKLDPGRVLAIPQSGDPEPVYSKLEDSQVAVIRYLGVATGTSRSMVAQWTWGQEETTDHYQVRWSYWLPTNNTAGGLWIIGATVNTADGTAESRYSTYTVPSDGTKVKVAVLPIAKTYDQKQTTAENDDTDEDKNLLEKGVDAVKDLVNPTNYTTTTEVKYWSTDWSKEREHIIDFDSPPVKLSPPSVTFNPNTLQLTLSYNNLPVEVTDVKFKVYAGSESTATIQTGILPVVNRHVEYSLYISNGVSYYVSASGRNAKNLWSEWSDLTDPIATPPSTPAGFTKAYAAKLEGSLSAHLEWNAVSNATEYNIEYATDKSYFDGGGPTQSETTINTSITITNVTPGYNYWFRIQAVNDEGSSPWIKEKYYKNIVIGERPGVPTTWSSQTKAITNDSVILYFTHNTRDGSYMEEGQIEWWKNGIKQTTIVIDDRDAPEEVHENNTKSYVLSTAGMQTATHIEWKARTKGVTDEYSDWSATRTIDVYQRPTLLIGVEDSSGDPITEITGYPFTVILTAEPTDQTPITFYLAITANNPYNIIGPTGEREFVNAGQEIYSKNFDISEHSIRIQFTPSDITLSNSASYTLHASVAMDSALQAQADDYTVDTSFGSATFLPNASIGINRATLTASIAPWAMDENDEYPSNVRLSVYRHNSDGKMTEIASDLLNNRASYVTDPHPTLDYARYRIVARNNITGEIQYFDPQGIPVLEPGILIQWNEQYRSTIVTSGAQELPGWSGDKLRLFYNVTIADSNEPDTELVNYIGREHPVSYYGTHLGHESTWQTEIPKQDIVTLAAIRRLAVWMGDAYVRESSGTGYWAHVKVSYTRSYDNLVIPVTFTIRRVEGGM